MNLEHLLALVESDRSPENLAVFGDLLEQEDPAASLCFRADLQLATLKRGTTAFAAAWERFLALRHGIDRSWMARALARYEVVLIDTGRLRIRCIKELRTLTGWDLQRAMKSIGLTPITVLSGLHRGAAEAVVQRLEEAGAQAAVVSTLEPAFHSDWTCSLRIPAVAGPGSLRRVLGRAVVPDDLAGDGSLVLHALDVVEAATIERHLAFLGERGATLFDFTTAGDAR